MSETPPQTGDAVSVDRVPLSDLARWPRNPKDHDIGALVGSFDRFGYVAPILVNRANGTILAGHGRLDALAEQRRDDRPPPDRIEVRDDGEWIVPVIAVDLDPNLHEAYVVTDNRLTELGGWNDAILVDVLTDLHRDGQLEVTGFDYDDLHALTSTFERDPPEIPPARMDEADALLKKWQVHQGELWMAGPHRIICGDALDAETVSRVLANVRPDMVWTDPPYNVDIGTIKHPKFRQRPIEGDDLDPDAWLKFCDQVAVLLAGVTDGCVYVCHAPNQDGRVMAAALDRHLHPSTTIVWVKDVFTLGRGKYQSQYEPLWFGWSKTGGHFTQRRDISNVWNIPRPKASPEHPTMKPPELVVRSLIHASKPGDVVFDPFLGSGTTIAAADQTGRVGYGIEIAAKYVAVTLERLEAMGLRPELVESTS